MGTLIIVFSFLFSLFALIYEIGKILKEKEFTIAFVVAILFIFSYGILPLLVIFMYEFGGVSISTYQHPYDYSDKGLFKTLIWQFFGVISYLIVRNITKKTVVSNGAQEDKYKYNYSPLFLTNIICLIIGIISLFLWSKAYGGIFELIKVGAAVRSGLSDVKNNLAFFKHPARLVLITSFSSLLLYRKSYSKFANTILFLVSFACSLLFLLANDGRLTTLTYFVIILFVWIDIFGKQKISKKKLISLCILATIGILFILELDTITHYIRYGEILKGNQSSVLLSIMDEFSFVIISGQKAIEEASTGSFLVFHDVMNGLTAWLPSSIKPFTFINIWDHNTELVTHSFFGQFPCDFISTSLYDLSFAGPIVFSLFWGNIIKSVEKLRTKNTAVHLVCYYAFVMSMVRIVDYCMLYDFVLGLFALMIFYLVYITIEKLFFNAR